MAALMAVFSKGHVPSTTGTQLARKELLINNPGRGECRYTGEIINLARVKYTYIKFSDSYELIFSIS